jgi:site-specific recombinase XerD
MYKAVIMTTYSAGLRNTEVRNLKVHDIDSKRMVIHVRNGKGQRDRQALLSPLTLQCLRTYWRLCRVNNPVKSDWLFMPTKNSHGGELKNKFSHTALGYIFTTAAKAARIKKKSIPTY